MVAFEEARDDYRRNEDPQLWLSIKLDTAFSRLDGRKGVMDLPMHALLTSSHTGKYDKKFYKLFKLLLKHGYDFDLQDFQGNSAFHIAMARGQLYNVAVYEAKYLRKHKHYTIKFVKGLCESGAQVNIQDNQKQQSPLHLAAKYNMWSCIQILIEYGACVNKPDYRGKTPLILALEHGCLESFACLLCHNADLHMRTSQQATALHFAVNTVMAKFDAFAVRKLLHHGADANAQDINGDTPLHIVARTQPSWDTTIIVRLLRYGADPTLLNKRGVTAFYEYLSNEKIFNPELPNDFELQRSLLEEQAITAFLACLPFNRPRILRDADGNFPLILQMERFHLFDNLIKRFGTENNPETLETQCVRKIRSCIGIHKLVDSSVTVWRLGLPKPIEDIVCSDRYRKAMEIPIPR
ncbi:LOW QUALITY PROTEIN: ankyrin repeat domain-containing protein 61-like [Amphiura filiformis]|uniref:LOW QUALITY PROTEIN: ankyrin repeat domain-containing protein 61-like n=1 Tax=Amphiura filiformis TaxID=82378 RepID=UPI003B20D75F